MSETKKSCAICYEEKRITPCFRGCSEGLCISCIRKLLSLNHEGKVMLKCPVCCRIVVNRKKSECEGEHDRKFSRFCLKVPPITSKIFELYEKETKKHYERDYSSDDESIPELIDSIIEDNRPSRMRADAQEFIPVVQEIGSSIRINNPYQNILNQGGVVRLEGMDRITALARRGHDFMDF